MRKILVDATVWIALFDPRDQDHKKMVRYWNSLKDSSQPVRFFTSDYVLDEAYTLLKVYVNPSAPTLLHKSVHESVITTVYFIGKNIYDEAWKIFSGYEDKKWSFTDCTSYVLMKRDGLIEVLTFDDHFRQMGFAVLPKEI